MPDDRPAKTSNRAAKTNVTKPRAEVQDAPHQMAHTEVRAPHRTPRPRAKTLPPELDDSDDDLFNDLPI